MSFLDSAGHILMYRNPTLLAPFCTHFLCAQASAPIATVPPLVYVIVSGMVLSRAYQDLELEWFQWDIGMLNLCVCIYVGR